MRYLFAVSALCGCATSPASDRCTSDPLVGTWALPVASETWTIQSDCTWSLMRRPLQDASGTWSRAGAQATFVPDTGGAATTVTPLQSGDRLVITDQTGAQLVAEQTMYPRISGGPDLADTTWGADTTTPDQGGSCSFVQISFQMMLHGDGTAMSTLRVTCQPANMPYLQSLTGTWSPIEAGDAFTFQFPDPNGSTQPMIETWARFGDSITDVFFIRAP